jgi:hypothetical protein
VIAMLVGCSTRGDDPDGMRRDGGVRIDGSSSDSGVGTDTSFTRPDTGPGVDGGALCSDPLDVVFVIDVSTSMADEIEQIRAGIDSIWSAAQALTANTQFGLVVFVDDVVAVNACGPFASREAMQTEFMRWREFTSSNNQPGGSPYMNSDCPENSIDALHLAASSCPWRDGATHIVIHVTDDTFAERPASLSGFAGFGGIPVAHTYPEAVMALQMHEVRVGTFAAPTAEACGAGTSSDTAQGFHTPYRGMPAIPEATSGRAWNIRDVRAGTLDMAEAINEFTAAEYCTLY